MGVDVNGFVGMDVGVGEGVDSVGVTVGTDVTVGVDVDRIYRPVLGAESLRLAGRDGWSGRDNVGADETSTREQSPPEHERDEPDRDESG